MTVVLFLTSLILATTLGWLSCALMTARTVQRAEAWGHRCVAREARLLAEAAEARDAQTGYWVERMVERAAVEQELRTRLNERDEQLRELAAFLAVVAP